MVTNGFFTLDLLFESFSPQRFPVPGVYVVAPFWSDVSTVGGNSRIRYEVRSTITGGTPIEAVNTYIRHKKKHTMFEAKWMLVAKWEEVPEYESLTSLV